MLLELLTPKNVNLKKIRLGPKDDGGYVVPEILLKNCSSLFTYGVGHNWGFEDDFAKEYNKPVHMFDHTLGKENWSINNVHFYNEGLGFSENCKDVTDHYSELNIEGDIFLKVDVEGAEYDYFLQTDIEKISSFTNGISLEIHWIDNPEKRNQFIEMMHKLSPYFTLCHIHGNNWGNVFYIDNFNIPNVLELTFINKKLVTLETEELSTFPIDGLDLPNNPAKKDIPLDFINYKENPEKINHYYRGVPSGWFDYEAVYDIAISRIAENTPAKFVELGVWFGQSMCYAGVEIINSKKDITLHGIDSFLHGDQPDPDSPDDHIRYSEALRYTDRVKKVVTLIKSDTHDANELYDDQSLDFVFIDANHLYEGMKLDLENWYPKVKKGGMIGGHDYDHSWPGLIQAVNEFFGENVVIKDSNSSAWYYFVN
jgi:hypothetical protein